MDDRVRFSPRWPDLTNTSHSHMLVFLFGSFVFLLVAGVFSAGFKSKISLQDNPLVTYAKFVYSCFLKPHKKHPDGGQQSALESFYATQAAVYDATRKTLLRGREDMLGLLAAQLRHKVVNGKFGQKKPVWVDVGGGTGYNIEMMSDILDVGEFFDHVYLVDFSPSLCEVARQRVRRMGWLNVSVLCEDARAFEIKEDTVELITMSYSLSMIPDYYSVLDSLTARLAPTGLVGACDFYVQSIVDLSSRNYVGGTFDRHVNWLGRMFWRAWFDFDRVNLDGGRRDYLEYRFGTILTASSRNYLLGGIPYYIFLGCRREVEDTVDETQEALEKIDAALTESPYPSTKHHPAKLSEPAKDAIPLRSKAYESAIVNLVSKLPLPSAFYQNHHWRTHYNDLLEKHQQFAGEYIYAFNWEDPRVDRHLLNITKDDVILTITSAGDNILDYLLEGPRTVHAVDLNPNQNHLLELKIAAFSTSSHADIWKMFGDGKHADFHDLLVDKLSAHMSSQALQYWLNHTSVFTKGYGLYETGGSRIAIKLSRWLFAAFGTTKTVRSLCNVDTLNEQKELWPQLRRIFVSRPLHWLIVGSEWFAWKAAGVPPAQRQLIQDDFSEWTKQPKSKTVGGEAIWQYMVNTFDPVARETQLSNDNYFYHMALQGRYSTKCHPRYLDVKAYEKLSRPGTFDDLHIHTDELIEVIARIHPGTLTIAVVMDSMDWFDPTKPDARTQVVALNKVLKVGGKVMFRSAAYRPFYTDIFEQNGFGVRCVGKRTPGKCIDRVNMYASCWVCTKTADVPSSAIPTADPALQEIRNPASKLEKLET